MKRVIIEHPRCGLTWIRVFLTAIGKREERKDYTFSHDCMGMRHSDAKRIKLRLAQRESALQDNKVCFLIRDPRDVIESNYCLLDKHFHAQRIPKTFVDFLHSQKIGLIPLLKWWQWWDQRKEKCLDWYFMQFEETKINPRRAFRGLLRFFDYKISEHLFERALVITKTPALVESKKPKRVIQVNTANGSSKKWKKWTREDQQWAEMQMKKYPSSFSERYLVVL